MSPLKAGPYDNVDYTCPEFSLLSPYPKLPQSYFTSYMPPAGISNCQIPPCSPAVYVTCVLTDCIRAILAKGGHSSDTPLLPRYFSEPVTLTLSAFPFPSISLCHCSVTNWMWIKCSALECQIILPSLGVQTPLNVSGKQTSQGQHTLLVPLMTSGTSRWSTWQPHLWLRKSQATTLVRQIFPLQIGHVYVASSRHTYSSKNTQIIL